MKSGQLLGGIVIGALLGVGIGYVIGVDAEKRNQWMRTISSKMLGCSCCDEEQEYLPEKSCEKCAE